MDRYDKIETMQKISNQGIIAVVRGQTLEEGLKIADACIAGGVKVIEMTFTTPLAHEAIAKLQRKYQKDDCYCQHKFFIIIHSLMIFFITLKLNKL